MQETWVNQNYRLLAGSTLHRQKNWRPWHLVRILCIGAHPDDCEYRFSGAAAKFAALKHEVKFLSMTCGDAGHHVHSGAALAEIRRGEAERARRRLGIAASEVLPNHDGELVPSLEARREVVRQIRAWRADIVITHRPWDYHPDHRYTSQIVQDAAYLVVVPNICPEVERLPQNPVFLYLEDDFQLPVPFAPDIALDIDDVWEVKIASLDAHVSQFYEWLPWVDGTLDDVPVEAAARREWLSGRRSVLPSACVRGALERRYGATKAREIHHAEAFQICEYGRRPSRNELDEMFPR
jgi:LmbE family N-acetylglucosaminyl deacetylase